MGDVGTRGGGEEGIPLYKLCRHVPPRRVEGLRRCGLKTGIHFVQFGLESGMVFEGTTDLYERLCRFNPNEWERKKNMRIRSGFEEFFCLRSKLSNDNIISA